MKKFLAIYYAPASAASKMDNATPEEKAAAMQPWMDWNTKSGDKIVDFGAPLTPGNSIDQSGNWSLSSKEVTGYSIVQSENLDAAKALFDGHPHISWAPGTSVEIHEFIAM